jgi:ketosteroid isomerase-like protein
MRAVVVCTALAVSPGAGSMVRTPILAIHASQQPAPEPDVDLSKPDVRAIVQIAKDYERAYAAGNVDSLMTAYSPQIVYMSQGMAAHTGLDVLRGLYATMFQTYKGTVDVQFDEVKVFGDVAYDRASFTINLVPKAGGEPRVVTGRLMEILRKQNGKWQSIRVMTNSDHADAGMGQ